MEVNKNVYVQVSASTDPACVVDGKLSLDNLVNYIKKVNDNPTAQEIHFDLMDGKYCDRENFNAKMYTKACEAAEKRISCHLMIKNSLKLWKKFVNDKVDSIIFQYDAIDHDEFVRTIPLVKQHCKVGIAINPSTHVHQIQDLLDKVDVVVVMTVVAGKSGQEMDQNSLVKCRTIKISNPDMFIYVDGGVNAKTSDFAFKNGADAVVMGTYMYDLLK